MRRFLSEGIEGCGGVVKEVPEDFLVEEIPSYEPCGSGEHLYLTIEKRGITTLEAVRRIARHFAINESEVGYAGMKDAVGVTRQTLSLRLVRSEQAEGLELDKLRVISASRHTNKLKPGHLKGNRFRIRVRDIAPGAAETVPRVLALFGERGVPNYFGAQRYGSQGNSHLIGQAMLKRDWKMAVDCLIGRPEAVNDTGWRSAIEAYCSGDIRGALSLMPRHCRTESEVLRRLDARPGEWEKAFSVINPRLKKLYLSAFQSRLFDDLLERRLDTLDRVMTGDLAWKHANGACFLVEDEERELPRAAAFEISASGPMFGSSMKAPAGLPLEMERAVLEAAGISPGVFEQGTGLRMEGERRPLRVPLGEASFMVEDSDLVLGFSLPRGSYATSVLRELTKVPD